MSAWVDNLGGILLNDLLMLTPYTDLLKTGHLHDQTTGQIAIYLAHLYSSFHLSQAFQLYWAETIGLIPAT